MTLSLLISIPFCVACIASAVIHPSLVRFARMKNLVDNPNTRKLQIRPVPVLGGIGVFFGIMLGLVGACAVIDCSSLFVIFGCMLLMMYVGAMDDMLDISPAVRLAAQIVVVLILISIDGLSLDDFHGLWGIGSLPAAASVPLTVFAVVGIINALNLIDGVDGLFSMFTMATCTLFGTIFLFGGDFQLFVLAAASIGAMIPFLLHNAFGNTSKMFVGDGGTLLMGVVLSVFVMEIVSNPVYGKMFAAHNLGVVPFALAALAVPVFDTVRVMTARILHGGSPFIGDKTHLHHMFIWLGVSHIGTAVSIVVLNLFVVLTCWKAAQAGLSVDAQFYIVIAAALFVTCGIYYGVRLVYRLNPERMDRFRDWKSHHRPDRAMFDFMQRLVDRF